MNYREKMREYLKEPNEICNHYGKWGILNKEQRDLITRLLNEMDGADNYIKKMQQENAQLKDKIEKAIDKLEYYNSGEALWYVPIQEIIEILKKTRQFATFSFM